ncbi:MAG: hypothetical protein BRD21_08505 [Halobacteriales archaeon SW_8_66_22]|nr:MAG: hypothetical protein BRD21_08505 [Halobacteriales archaeon SW_8_66_22]
MLDYIVNGMAVMDLAFSIALIAGALLFVGGLVSFAGFAYKTTRGEGMEDPRDAMPENEDELTEGDTDDEWDYY